MAKRHHSCPVSQGSNHGYEIPNVYQQLTADTVDGERSLLVYTTHPVHASRKLALWKESFWQCFIRNSVKYSRKHTLNFVTWGCLIFNSASSSEVNYSFLKKKALTSLSPFLSIDGRNFSKYNYTSQMVISTSTYCDRGSSTFSISEKSLGDQDHFEDCSRIVALETSFVERSDV